MACAGSGLSSQVDSHHGGHERPGWGVVALTPGKGFLAYRESGGTVHTYVQLKAPLDWLVGT